MKKYCIVCLLISILLSISCRSNDDFTIIDEPEEEVVLAEEVELFELEGIENSLVLAVVNAGKSSYLVNKKGEILKSWDFDIGLGNDLELLPSGKLLGIFKASNLSFFFGGFGGIVRIINIDGSIDWEFNYYSDNLLAHHDVEMLPSGNILIMAWERILAEEAKAMGIDVTFDVFTESLIEVDPNTNKIVWEWHTKDHIIQDTDSDLPNFGIVKDNPQLINHNYNIREDGDLMHANGIDYDLNKDLIYLSVNFYSEVWVIDHSTTTIEASSHEGGNYNKGGDLIYRFGNPEAYNNTFGTRLFDNNHFPNFLESDEPGAGNILVFNNNTAEGQSIVHEFKMPNDFQLNPDSNNEPEEVWRFTDSALFNSRISGAVRLKNGNTLICEGDYGFWEVTPEKEVVWKYNGSGRFWRAYNYFLTDSEIINLNL
ncbi:aryl-sulfate sulfotransferase [Hyunsoonleella aestuarii]|uniref:Aryl-sulfate sulfotransferase n=1 Tax=Hyunsoonleella aestuarii TaxID=912802 RepID=A0ABP8E802_9FLAO|nr:aryl-sulfate sulfotransferase [Hyunsoonleella aestuarii]